MPELLIIPILPARGSVLFPELAVSFIVGRIESLAASRAASKRDDQAIAVFAQRDLSTDRITDTSQLYRVGTRGFIESITETDDGIRVKIVGIQRVLLQGMIHTEPFLSGAVSTIAPPANDVPGLPETYLDPLLDLVRKLLELVKPETSVDLDALETLVDEPLALSYAVASMFDFGVEEDQRILEAPTISQTVAAVLESGTRQLRELEQRKSSGLLDSAT